MASPSWWDSPHARTSVPRRASRASSGCYGTWYRRAMRARSSRSETPIRIATPRRLAGGIFFLDEDSFEAATLKTFDGNDYFAISILTRSVEILVQDENSTYP